MLWYGLWPGNNHVQTNIDNISEGPFQVGSVVNLDPVKDGLFRS